MSIAKLLGLSVDTHTIQKTDRHPNSGKFVSKERGKSMNPKLNQPKVADSLSSLRTRSVTMPVVAGSTEPDGQGNAEITSPGKNAASVFKGGAAEFGPKAYKVEPPRTPEQAATLAKKMDEGYAAEPSFERAQEAMEAHTLASDLYGDARGPGVVDHLNYHIRKATEYAMKRDFSKAARKDLAKTGKAMPDGSFPIETHKDLENAVHDVGRATDPAAAKAHIIQRAKHMGAVDKLPPDWKVSKAASPDNPIESDPSNTDTMEEDPATDGLQKPQPYADMLRKNNPSLKLKDPEDFKGGSKTLATGTNPPNEDGLEGGPAASR